MSDLTEQLRKPMPRKCEWIFRDYEGGHSEGPFDPIRLEAADEIERLNAQLAEAHDAALEKAAKVAALVMSECFEAVTAIDAVDLPTETQQWNRHLYQGGYRASTDIVAAIRALKGKT